MESDDEPTIADPEVAGWAAKQRERVIEYLSGQRLEHGGVSLEPRWFFRPHIAVWAVRSKANPDYIGWWAISGNLPTDYLTSTSERDSTDVLMSFSRQWKAAAAQMTLGKQVPGYRIGPPGKEKELAPLLLSRAESLERIAGDLKAGAQGDER